MLAKLLAIVLAWTPTWYPPGGGPETREQRTQRWAMASDTMVQSGGSGITKFWPQDNVALIATIFRYESALDYHVHGGEPSPIGSQDKGKARCLGQIQQSRLLTKKEWVGLAGRDRAATRRCADMVLRVMWYHAKRCKMRQEIPGSIRWRAMLTDVEARVLFTAYGTGITCGASGKHSGRARLFGQIRGRL